jgi:hypothetical protein
MTVIMKHPNGTTFRHSANLWKNIFAWKTWLWNYRNGYRFKWER